MSLILSGTDGLSDVDGTAATPAIRGTDANTGIFFPAADTIAFSEGGAEAMRIDSSGFVGIGTSTPSPYGGALVVRKANTGQGVTNATAQFSDAVNSALWIGHTSGATNLVSDQAITFGLTNGTATTERVRIDSSGNVGIGTTAPQQRLGVKGASNVPQLYLMQDNVANDGWKQFADSSSGSLNFLRTTAGVDTEYMRISFTGDLRLGSLAITQGNADAKSTIYGGATDSSPCLELFKGSATTSTAQVFMRFQTGQAGTPAGNGSITANGAAAAAFTNWSDSRLKENIVDLPSQLDNIMALRPVEFDYIESMGGGHQLGFIAQEVQEIYPDLVGEGADGMLTLTDMNKNDARLIKAIQEMKAIIDTQVSTITALTARITALETP